VNNEHQIVAVGWLDNKPVHFISTSDTSEIVEVKRRSGRESLHVSAPVVVHNYNKYMGGVDCHDRLRSTFSLCKRHGFKKYYVKLLLFLVDIGLTNAWVYYQLCNEELCNKDGARADFFEQLAESMVNGKTNWQKYDNDVKKTEVSTLDTCYNNEGNYKRESCGNMCIPVHLSSLPMELSTKIKICQVCRFEERKPKWKSVMLCRQHGVRLCTEAREQREACEPILKRKDGSAVTDFTWSCQTTDSCWNKFHQFYQPKGLFNNNFSLDSKDKVKFASYAYGSLLYQKKYAALGGNQTRTPRLSNKKLLQGKTTDSENESEEDIAYLQQSSESSQEVSDDEEEE